MSVQFFTPYPQSKMKGILDSFKAILSSTEPDLDNPESLLRFLQNSDLYFPNPTPSPCGWNIDDFYMDSPRYVKPPAMGLTLEDGDEGAVVTGWCDGGWADQSMEVRIGDTIIWFNGQQAPTKAEIHDWWSRSYPGEHCYLKLKHIPPTDSNTSSEGLSPNASSTSPHFTIRDIGTPNTVLMRRTLVTLHIHKAGLVVVDIDTACGVYTHGDEFVLEGDKKSKMRVFVGMAKEHIVVYDPDKVEYSYWKERKKTTKQGHRRLFDKSLMLCEAQIQMRRLMYVCRMDPDQLYYLQMDHYESTAHQQLDIVVQHVQKAHPDMDPAVVESTVRLAGVSILKAGKSLKEVVKEVHHLMRVNATSLPSTKVAVARVIDFLAMPRSKDLCTTLRQLGFYVNPTLNAIQKGPSCGYIAAKVATELHKAGSPNWLQVDLSHCTHKSIVQEGNIVLCNNDPSFKPPSLTTPVWLTATEVECLVKHWHGSNMSLWFDGALSYNYFTQGLVERKLSGSAYPGRICIVNTADAVLGSDKNKGVHWFVCGYSINSERLREDDEMSNIDALTVVSERSTPTSLGNSMFFPPAENDTDDVDHHPNTIATGLTTEHFAQQTTTTVSPPRTPSHSSSLSSSSSHTTPSRQDMMDRISGALDALAMDDLVDVFSIIENKVKSKCT